MVDRERTGDERASSELDARIAEAARERTDALSGPIQERLAAARRQAVAAMDDTPVRSGFRWSYALPAGVAAAVTLVVALQLTLPAPDTPDAATLAELLAELDGTQEVAAPEAALEMELLEDLEFLAWMAEVEEVNAG